MYRGMQNIFHHISGMDFSKPLSSVPVWSGLVVFMLFSDDTVNVYPVFSAPIKNPDQAIRHLYGDALRFAPVELRWIGNSRCGFDFVHIFHRTPGPVFL